VAPSAGAYKQSALWATERLRFGGDVLDGIEPGLAVGARASPWVVLSTTLGTLRPSHRYLPPALFPIRLLNHLG